MAKWGEGDPRWIVEQRVDGTNVNNWHWTEKNADGWSKDRLKSILLGVKIEGNAGVGELTEMTSMDGEASVCNRKQKLITLYSWELKMKWKGTTSEEDDVSGTLEIPNLSDEQDISDIEVNVTVVEKDSKAYALKEQLRTQGADIIREKLAQYIDGLREEYSRGVILSTDKTLTPNSSSNSLNDSVSIPNATLSASQAKPAKPSPAQIPESVGVKLSTKKISMKEEFMCAKDYLYQILTEKDMVQAWSRDPIKLYEFEKGGRFNIFGGNITGEFQDMVPDECLVWRWAFKGWPPGHYSTVTIKLKQESNCVVLTLSQTGVPSDWVDKVKTGWSNYYWNPIRMRFGISVDAQL